MKINTTITTHTPLEIDLTPNKVITALQREIVARINSELASLNLPPKQLKMPLSGFHSFAYRNSRLYGLYDTVGDTYETEIVWGVQQFLKAWRYHIDLDQLKVFLG